MRKYEIILSIAFLFVLLLPLLGTFVGGKDFFPTGNESAGKASLIHSIGDFKYQFGENYAFREQLISLNGIIKMNLMGVSSSQRVLVGKMDWLYLADEQTLDNHRNIYSFTESDINLWKRTLQAREAFCDDNGCEYFFTISPDKVSIYPEFLPNGYGVVGTTSRKDLFRKNARAWGVNYIELEERIIHDKAALPLYYRTDTHWNELGAYSAYCKILEAIDLHFGLKEIVPVTPYWEEKSTHGGDLARLMGMEDRMGDLLEQAHFNQNARMADGTDIDFQMIDVQHVGEIHTVCDTGELGRAVIFHDSFGVALIPYFAEHFREALFIRSNDFMPEKILDFKADMVIQQIVERRLLNWKPDINEMD